MPRRSQTSRMRSYSSLGITTPVGLFGEFTMIIFVRGVIAFCEGGEWSACITPGTSPRHRLRAFEGSQGQGRRLAFRRRLAARVWPPLRRRDAAPAVCSEEFQSKPLRPEGSAPSTWKTHLD